LDEAITLDVSLGLSNRTANELAVTTVLQRKGRVQDALADSLSALRQRLGSADSKLLDDFGDVTTQLSRMVLGGPQNLAIDDYQKHLTALKENREALEAEISERSAGFRAASQPVVLPAVRLAIPENAVLLEFVSYRRFVPKGTTDIEQHAESRYVAYVVHPTGDVRGKDLGAAADIDAAIASYREALRDPKRTDVRTLARSLDETIFRPIREFVADANHLLISPDGQLNLIPFETLIDEQGRYAVEHYSISYLSTGRDLLRMQIRRKSASHPLLVADPVFGEPDATLVAKRGEQKGKFAPEVGKRRSITAADDLSSVYFAPLSGTAQEARAIQELFPDAKVLTGEQATKTALRNADAPTILHIATHGFFLSDTDEPPLAPSAVAAPPRRGISASAHIENPLLRSGLAFAGANINQAGGDDGILTAMEASNLNLWGTKLVTLSACDTGVGEVKNGEGVFGLRRAFFLAGSESLVMSLWSVNDYVTRELMVQYYAGLRHGLGRSEALRQAQLAMMNRRGREHPFYWASFIEAGEWANLDGQRTPPTKSQ
jgi:CHAT domain-containing protein